MSFWSNVILVKCPFGQMSYGQMSLWTNGFMGKAIWIMSGFLGCEIGE
jgi:hypothetical protein